MTHRKKLGISNIINLIISGEHIGVIKKLSLLLSSDDYEGKTKNEKMKEMLKLSSEIQKKENLWFLRNTGIYVNLDSSKTDFIHPGQISRNFAVNLCKKARTASIFLQVERDKREKFGESLDIDLAPISDILNALTIFEDVGSSLLQGSIEEIQEIKGLSPKLKDLLTKVLLDSYPIIYTELDLEINDINSLEELDKVFLILLYDTFKPLILKFKDSNSEKNFKEILDFSIERYKHYSPQRGELIATSIKFLELLSSKNIEGALECFKAMDKLFISHDKDF